MTRSLQVSLRRFLGAAEVTSSHASDMFDAFSNSLSWDPDARREAALMTPRLRRLAEMFGAMADEIEKGAIERVAS